MWQVLENGKPADCFHYKLHESWNKSQYETLEEAAEYAKKYFWPYLGEDTPIYQIIKLLCTESKPYSVYDSRWEIKFIENHSK